MEKRSLGYVYFVISRSENMVKIGWSIRHPDKRLSMLRVGSPVRLDRLGYMRGDESLEQKIHQRFWSFRTHGEWFSHEGELAKFIKEHAKPWVVRGKWAEQDRREAGDDWKGYDERLAALGSEWSSRWGMVDPNCPGWIDFFGFCREAGFRLKRRDTGMMREVNGRLEVYYPEGVILDAT